MLMKCKVPVSVRPFQADDTLGDLRFRALLTTQQWTELPQTVRHRFSKRLSGAKSAVYKGHVISTQMNTAGMVLAQLARIIGGPLPLSRDAGLPAVVTVTEDEATHGQFWSRHYNHHNGFPQVIHSSKRFEGATGLEEYVGRGIGMALIIDVEDSALIFKSAYYFLMLGHFRFKLPRWLSPGVLTVTHRAIDDQRFEFTLDVKHKLFGQLLHQRAVFEDFQP